MDDPEIRGRLLTHFYALRHNNGGWVPVSEIILAPEPVELRIIGGVCQQLADVGLIQWRSLKGSNGIAAGNAQITGQGVAAVESGRSAAIDIRFPSKGEIAPSIPSSETNPPAGERQRIMAAAGEEISEEGRRARFQHWDHLGLDRVKQDLLSGGHRVVGGPPQVRELAWEWVRIKEAEIKTGKGTVDDAARALGFGLTTPAEIARALGRPSTTPSEQSGPSIDAAEIMAEIMKESALPLPLPQQPSAPLPDRPPAEVITLKPTFMGMSIDLKEAGRRVRSWWLQRRGEPS